MITFEKVDTIVDRIESFTDPFFFSISGVIELLCLVFIFTGDNLLGRIVCGLCFIMSFLLSRRCLKDMIKREIKSNVDVAKLVNCDGLKTR